VAALGNERGHGEDDLHGQPVASKTRARLRYTLRFFHGDFREHRQ